MQVTTRTDDVLCWKGSFCLALWTGEGSQGYSTPPSFCGEGLQGQGPCQSSYLAYCGKQNVSTSEESLAGLMFPKSSPSTAWVSPCKDPTLLPAWKKAEPEHALEGFAALGEKNCSSEGPMGTSTPLHASPVPPAHFWSQVASGLQQASQLGGGQAETPDHRCRSCPSWVLPWEGSVPSPGGAVGSTAPTARSLGCISGSNGTTRGGCQHTCAQQGHTGLSEGPSFLWPDTLCTGTSSISLLKQLEMTNLVGSVTPYLESLLVTCALPREQPRVVLLEQTVLWENGPRDRVCVQESRGKAFLRLQRWWRQSLLPSAPQCSHRYRCQAHHRV